MTQFCLYIFGLLIILSSCTGPENETIESEKNNSNKLIIEFENASGLQIDDEVKCKGVVIGKVFEIDLSQNGQKVYVTLDLKKDKQIPKNSEIVIAACDILGTKCIEINYSTSKTYYGITDTAVGIHQSPALDSVVIDKFTAIFDSVLQWTSHLDQDSLKASNDSIFNQFFSK